MDARDVIVTDTRHTHAAPLFPQTYSKLAATIPQLAQKKVVVMGGFIGATEEGVTSTLGRGGSDFTAAIVGAGIGAEEIQIWTDVDGMLTSDPTVMPGGYRVKTISFAEAAELAYFGAKVLHPATVVPAIEKNIPGAHPELAPARSGRHSHRQRNRSLYKRGEVDRVQKEDHARQHRLEPHADGPWIPPPYLRSLRSL